MFKQQTIELPDYDVSDETGDAIMHSKLWISSKEAYITRVWEINGERQDPKSLALSHEQLAALGDIIANAKNYKEEA